MGHNQEEHLYKNKKRCSIMSLSMELEAHLMDNSFLFLLSAAASFPLPLAAVTCQEEHYYEEKRPSDRQ